MKIVDKPKLIEKVLGIFEKEETPIYAIKEVLIEAYGYVDCQPIKLK